MSKFKVGQELILEPFRQEPKTYKIIRVETLPYKVKDSLTEDYEDKPDPKNIAYVLEGETEYFWYNGKCLQKLAFHKDGDNSYYYPQFLKNYFLVNTAGSKGDSKDKFKF